MGEIKHFSHEEHSLKLIENWATVVSASDVNEEKKEISRCYGCKEHIIGGFVYGCILCSHYLHETCANLAPVINYPFHPKHPLTLGCRVVDWICDVCDSQGPTKGFSYRCMSCDFDACINCGLPISLKQEAAIALKREALIKFKHEGHPQHTLTLQLRPASFHCDACLAKDEDLFYQCDGCDFWMHKSCASLAHTIDLTHHPNHPLVLVYSLPDNFYNFPYYCEFCTEHIPYEGWLYHCANCRYFAHIKCALNAKQRHTPSDSLGTSLVEEPVNEFPHVPMSYAFTDPLKSIYLDKVSLDDDGATEINHWSHNHPLLLNVEPRGNNMPNIGCGDPIEVCYGCVRPLSLPHYNCKHGCSFTLHKYCAELPRTLEHQLHPNHSLDLVNTDKDEWYYECNGCFSYGNNFVYRCETCKFYLDVNCAFLPNTIKHISHKHPLIQVIDPNLHCNICTRFCFGISYACKACNIQVDMFCAIQSPYFLTHRYCKGHKIPLTYPPVENHPEDFYCDICEYEMHPKRPLYHCHKCKNSFHLRCINKIDIYANVKGEGTVVKHYHKHPLTFVRIKATPEYVCFFCNRDINGRLILKCRTETCPFRICYRCSRPYLFREINIFKCDNLHPTEIDDLDDDH